MPDLLLTNEMSALLRLPSTVTSDRKLVPESTCPERDLVWLISAEFTLPSPVVSPTRAPIVVAATPILPALSCALLIAMVVYCPFVTPVRFTVY